MRSEIASNLSQWLVGEGETALAARFPDDPRIKTELNVGMFPERLQEPVKIFENTGVAYDFTFDMTETDNLDAGIDFVAVLRHTLGSIGISAGIDRTRENLRTFTITDTFTGLLNMDQPGGEKGYCRKYIAIGNKTYPITGKLGLGELVHSFFVTSLFSNLDGVKHEGPPSMGDALTFTTKLSGSLLPKAAFGQAFRGFQILDVSLTAATSRTDEHKLVVALALPEPVKPAEPAATSNSTARKPATAPRTVSLRSSSFTTGLTASSTGEESALRKIDQIILRFQLGRSNTIILGN